MGYQHKSVDRGRDAPIVVTGARYLTRTGLFVLKVKAPDKIPPHDLPTTQLGSLNQNSTVRVKVGTTVPRRIVLWET